MRKWAAISTIPLCLALFGGSSLVQAGGSWTDFSPMPTARDELATASVNGIVYAIGGYAGNGCTPVGTVEAYDPTTNSWTTKTPMPTPRYGVRAAEVNGIIYAIGGGANCGTIYNIVEAYDPATDTWATKAPMPLGRVANAIGVIGGKIYVAGGDDAGGIPPYVGPVAIYDPSSDTWTLGASMPTPLDVTAGAGVGGLFYVVGGSDGVTCSNCTTMEVYDPGTDSWTTGAPMPTGRGYLSAASAGGLLYTLGGYVEPAGHASTVVESYDPATGTWSEQPSMLHPQSEFSAVVANGVLYAVGGQDNNSGSGVLLNVFEGLNFGAAVISVSPSSIAFGHEPVNHTSKTRQIAVSNTGTSQLHVGALSVIGANARDFAVNNNGCFSAVAPGQSCTISLTFHPSYTGERTGALQVPSDASNGLQSVPLSGTGTGICVRIVLGPHGEKICVGL